MTRTQRRLRKLFTGLATLALFGLTVFAGPHASASTGRQGDLYLSRDKIVLKSALFVDLTKGIVRLPLHKGAFHGTPVWYVITDVSDFGLAHEGA